MKREIMAHEVIQKHHDLCFDDGLCIDEPMKNNLLALLSSKKLGYLKTHDTEMSASK